MTLLAPWLLLFVVSVCNTQNDAIIEASGEGSGEDDPVSPETVSYPQTSVIQQIGDSNDDLELTTIANRRSDGCGVDLVFLLDASGSLEQIYTQHINWTSQLVDTLLTSRGDQVHIAVIQYAETSITEFSLGTYKDSRDIINHIMAINFHSGGTRTGRALMAADSELFSQEKGARSNASKIIVLFTDGLSIDDPLKHAQQLREKQNVKIYVVSVGSDGFVPEMNRIAGTKSNVFGPTEYSQLQKSLIDDVERARICPKPFAPQTRQEKVVLAAEAVGTLQTAIITTSKTNSKPWSGTLSKTKEASHKTTRTGASVTTRSASGGQQREPVTKDAQLKHKNKKFPIEQAAVPQAQLIQEVTESRLPKLQIAKIPEVQVLSDKESDAENIDESPIEVIGEQAPEIALEPSTTERNLVRDITRGETAASPTKPMKPRKKRPQSNRSSAEKRKTSRQLSIDVTNTKITSVSRSATTHRISIPTTKRPQRQPAHSGSAGENGRSQVHCPREILFIVDSSGSVQKIYDQQKEYLMSLLNELQIGEDEQRVALVQFAGSTHQRVEWTFDTYDNVKDIAEALAQVRHFTGTTFIGRALENSVGILETRRQGIPTTVILVSDGFSQDDASKPAEEIRRMPNVDFYAVSMSDLNNFEYLAKLTDDPTKVYVGQRSEDLKQDLLKVIRCRT